MVNQGDSVKVKVIGFDERGKVKLSMRVVDQATGADITEQVGAKPNRGGDRPERGERDRPERGDRRDRYERSPSGEGEQQPVVERLNRAINPARKEHRKTCILQRAAYRSGR